MKLQSRELETWARLVTPTVKRALADAARYLRDTDHTITAFLASIRPVPLTANELVNEVRPVSQLRPFRSNGGTTFFFSFRGSQRLGLHSYGSISVVSSPRGVCVTKQ